MCTRVEGETVCPRESIGGSPKASERWDGQGSFLKEVWLELVLNSYVLPTLICLV